MCTRHATEPEVVRLAIPVARVTYGSSNDAVVKGSTLRAALAQDHSALSRQCPKPDAPYFLKITVARLKAGPTSSHLLLIWLPKWRASCKTQSWQAKAESTSSTLSTLTSEVDRSGIKTFQSS